MTQTDRRLTNLSHALNQEKLAHARTRQTLQNEIQSWQQLAPGGLLDLMNTYPALRRLLKILTTADQLQNPLRSQPPETTRTNGNSPTEAAYHTHQQYRTNVQRINQELDILHRRLAQQVEHTTHQLAAWTNTTDTYQLPPPPICHRKTCPARGRQQSHTNHQCEGCGRTFRQ